MFPFKTCTVLLVAVALPWLAASYAGASVVTMDFGGVQTPIDATAYLNSFGITLSNVWTGGPNGAAAEVQIVDPRTWNDAWAASESAYGNCLMQNGAGAPPLRYTMNFSTPLLSISFTRIPTPSGLTTEPVWSATAYVGTEAVGSVGEAWCSWGGSPAHTFTLSGNGITSLTINSDGGYFTGIGAVPLDNFELTPVPEPTTIIIWSLLGGFGIAIGWQRLRKAA
jgi:hypothetical protein